MKLVLLVLLSNTHTYTPKVGPTKGVDSSCDIAAAASYPSNSEEKNL